MSTLYIRLPSKVAADSSSNWPDLDCPFALISKERAIERQGTAPLSDLSETLKKSQQVVALLASSDVTLLRMAVPPLSPSKLKAALPNIVEEQLIDDPSDCVMASGELSDGMLTIAVAQRDWLDRVAKTLISFGAHHLSCLPSQLCLAYQSGMAGAAVNEIGEDIDIAIRLSEYNGIGLAIKHEQDGSAASAALRTIEALIPNTPVTLYVPKNLVQKYQEVLGKDGKEVENVKITGDSWADWISSAQATSLDLAAGLGLGKGHSADWRTWRWPLALAAAVLIVNVTALNIDWWRMKKESQALRTSMTQIYKTAFPNESVIIDPIAQMQQKITIAKRNSGLAAADDFTTMAAAVGEAWSSASGRIGTIASLEYRDHTLFMRLKQGVAAPTQQVQSFLATRNMTLEMAPEQLGATVWKIRSIR